MNTKRNHYFHLCLYEFVVSLKLLSARMCFLALSAGRLIEFSIQNHKIITQAKHNNSKKLLPMGQI